MCEKIKRVRRWLETVFGADGVPNFEVNTRTIQLLDELMQISEQRCEDVSLLTHDCRQKAAEYNSDATYLQEVLHQGVGLQPGSVTKSTSDFLSVLEGTAEVLKVRDTSMGSFVPAINNVTKNLAEAEKTDRKLGQELAAMRKNMAATMIVRKKLQEDLTKIAQVQQVEAATAEERLLNMDFMKNKSRDLTYRNKIAKEKLASRQMKDSSTHQAIVQLAEKITALKQEITPLVKKLEPYNDLSPSPALARVAIEEVKRELEVLDAALEQKVDLMNTLSR